MNPMNEPPDVSSTFSIPAQDSPEVHHHLEMFSKSEIVVVAHPRYLKIRLFGFATERPQVLCRDLLEQLAALYRT